MFLNQLVEVCRQLDTHIPEQAIEVPKTSSSSRHSRRRRVRFAEQTAEQLVEVPTIVSHSSLRGLMEQNIDIPAPHGRGRVEGGGLHSLHPGLSTTAVGEAAATAEQIVDIPVPRGGRQDPDRPSAASSSGLPGMANQGFFFAFFPKIKKVRGWVRTRSRNWVRTSVHPRWRLSWRVSSRMQLAVLDAVLGSDPEVWWPG